MRINKKEFLKLLELLKTLTGQARDDLLAQLKSAEVYETDADGNEVKVEVEIVEKNEDDEPETKDNEKDDDEKSATKTGAMSIVKVTLDSTEIEKSVEAAIKKANEKAIKANRKVFAIGSPPSRSAIPDRAKRARVKNFTAYEGQESTPGERAYRFGMFVRAIAGMRDALAFCDDNEIELRKSNESDDLVLKDQVTTINSTGGFLVPEEFDTDMIDLRDRFGFFRQHARISPMGSDTKSRLRRTGGLTAHHVGEQQAGTKSTAQWDRVNLVARKLMALAVVSNELNADSTLSIGDTIAGEIAYAFASREDDDGFNGDGTSAYGGIVGLIPKLVSINGVDNGGGLILASGNLWSEIVLRDFQNVIAQLPQYADENPGCGWIVSKAFWGGVMQPLATAVGGTTAAEVINGNRVLTFLGYPVYLSQKMPTSQANSLVSALFGAMQLSTDFGDRAGTTIAISTEGVVDGVSLFETDQMAIRGTERMDINNHDLGTATEAGPIVGLITAAS